MDKPQLVVETPEEEKIDLPIQLVDLEKGAAEEETQRKFALSKLGKKTDKVHKYLHKMLKALRENDSVFSDRFLESLKINKEEWDTWPPVTKITSLFPIFDKLVIILRYHGLLRMFKEKVFRKLTALCKRYLKVFNTFRCYFTQEVDAFLDHFVSKNAAEMNAFTEDVKFFGYSRVEAEEAEKMKVK